MQLLNVGFAILLIKVAISVLPGVLGIYLIAASEEAKRSMRSAICNQLFGISNAIPFDKFSRFLYIIATLSLLFSGVAAWFLLLRKFFAE